MQKWTQVDNMMVAYGFPDNLKQNTNTITGLVMFAALGKKITIKLNGVS